MAESELATLSKALQQLLASGRFSDLILTCDGQHFRVHKAIVCSQSPMLAAAVRNGFEEARTNTIEVNFPVEAVERMLSFLYTGKYSVVDGSDAKEASRALVKVGTLAGLEAASVSDVPEALLAHEAMNQIADYYQIPDLVELANSNIQDCLDTDWSVAAFCHVAETLSGATGDQEWQRVLAGAARSHVADLSISEELSKMECMQGLGLRCFQVCLGRLSDLEHELMATKDLLAGAELKAERLADFQEGVLACHQRLHDTISCSNCDKEFGCEITPRIKPSDEPYLVRCSGCRCKH